MYYVLVSVVSLVVGSIGTFVVLKFLIGGSPQIIEAKCDGGKLKFRLNPNPLMGITECIKVTSTINGMDPVDHDPKADPSMFQERPFPSTSPVMFAVTCQYALFPNDVETAGPTSVQPCASSSSSSSSSSS
jgi:hypothetical protein